MDGDGADSMAYYAMYARTVQASVLKVLFDCLRDLLVDTLLQFGHEGVKIQDLDNTNVVMLHLRLEANKFEEYHCDGNVSIGINVAHLHSLLKTVKPNDTLTLYQEKDDVNHLGVRVENHERRTRTEFKLNLLDLDKSEYAIPPVGFNSCIVLPSADLQKIVRDMSSLSDRVEIRNIGRELVLKCSGNFCNQETVLQDTEQGGDDDDDGDGAPADHDASLIKQGVFPLRYLLMFTKCSSLSPNVEIYLKNEFPLILKYKLAALGDLKMCLVPIRSMYE